MPAVFPVPVVRRYLGISSGDRQQALSTESLRLRVLSPYEIQEAGTVLYRIRSHERLEAKGGSDAQEPGDDFDRPARALGQRRSAERLQYDIWCGKRHIRHRAGNHERRRRGQVGPGCLPGKRATRAFVPSGVAYALVILIVLPVFGYIWGRSHDP